MGILIIIIIVTVIAVCFMTSNKSTNSKISVNTVKEGVREALFVEGDADHFLYYREKYTEKEYVDEIEKALVEYKNSVNSEFDKRKNMDRKQLIDLRKKIFLLCTIDEENKDVWSQKFDSIHF